MSSSQHWDALFSLSQTESDQRVNYELSSRLFFPFFKHVLLMDNMVDMLSDVKLQPTKILTAICGLLHTLKSNKGTKEKNLSHSISEQGFEMGIALPSFLLNIEVASGGIVLLWIVGVCLSFKIFKVYWKLKNIKQEHAKFWKQHPELVKVK
ncbi:hypothetical protein LXL04_034833 [Taraxacum kok-saghyz]